MIHPTAIIDPGARLADDVEIGAYTIIGPQVSIDNGCRVGPHVVLNGPMRIGKNNRIYQFASLGDAPQDLKYAGEPTAVEIGDGNVFREYVTVNRGTAHGGGVTRVGNHNLLMAYVHVAHDCVVGDHTVFANAASLAGHVTVGDFAILGGFTTVHQFSTLGEHCFTGLSTAVNRDVPPFVVAVGNYARSYGINKNGLRRRGFDAAVIRALQTAYRSMVYSRGARNAALAELAPLCERYPEVRRFVEFIRNSKRGIVR